MKKLVFSESQLAELTQLMSESKTQSEIAAHFNITEDTLRRIIKEAGLSVSKPYICVCKLCGKQYRSNRRDSSICSDIHTAVCEVCGNSFVIDRSNIKTTCSKRCTSLLKYGVEDYRSCDTVKQHRVNTVRTKYGVTNVSQLCAVQDKIKSTYNEQYGCDHPMQNSEYKEAICHSNVEKYGVPHVLGKGSPIREAFELANLEKYGTRHPNNIEKGKSTLQARYGVDNPMAIPGVKDKISEECLSKYGVSWGSRSDEVKSKIQATVLERYGVSWACMRDEARNHHTISKINKEFQSMLCGHNIDSELEFRINDKSYDLKVSNTLIEIDPTITHNSAMSIWKDAEPLSGDYHRLKTQLALDSGYRCVHVFDWDSWESILSIVSPTKKIYARKCTISKVSEELACTFTSQYHIRGSCRGQKCNYGLYYEGELVEVMTFGKSRYSKRYDWELLRLCTKHGLTVVGGASKLFSHFCADNTGSIISYCDLAKFDGSVYTLIGMTLHHVSAPAKIWSKGDKYITDNLLRERGYDQLFGTDYGKGSSNDQLMIENGWLPVYDCGQAVFEYLND